MTNPLTRLIAAAPWGELRHVTVGDPNTWRLAEDRLPGGYRVVTSFHPVRFSPSFGMAGSPHHFETLVTSTTGEIGNSESTYATEAEAIDGHAVILARVRTSVERGAA